MGVAEKGIEFNLSYSDEGDKLDWSRWGKPGFAQRFQIQEPNKHATKKEKQNGTGLVILFLKISIHLNIIFLYLILR